MSPKPIAPGLVEDEQTSRFLRADMGRAFSLLDERREIFGISYTIALFGGEWPVVTDRVHLWTRYGARGKVGRCLSPKREGYGEDLLDLTLEGPAEALMFAAKDVNRTLPETEKVRRIEIVLTRSGAFATDLSCIRLNPEATETGRYRFRQKRDRAFESRLLTAIPDLSTPPATRHEEIALAGGVCADAAAILAQRGTLARDSYCLDPFWSPLDGRARAKTA